MGTRERRDRSDQADREISTLFQNVLDQFPKEASSIAIGAVGGYGRGELFPGSDLDLLILHEGAIGAERLGEIVNAFLYPLWDTNRSIDHSVRSRGETRETAAGDIKVALGLLDLRFVAGNRSLVETVASDAQEDWRRNFAKHYSQLKSTMIERAERSGELAFLLEPDLKEARGGLRDVNAIRAIAVAGLVPVAMDRLASAEALLSNVRESLHLSTGRNRDVLLFGEQDRIALAMKFQDADALMLEVAKAARTVDYVVDLTLHRIDHRSEGKKRKFFAKRDDSVAVGPGLVAANAEVAIDVENPVDADPGIGLRAAAAAAQRGLPLSIDSCIWLAENFQPLPEPWPRQVREDLVALLGAGQAMIQVWEALDQEGIISRWIPEWEHVRFLPQRNVLHRHTVDRHMLETTVRAAALIRTVHRPDLLLFAATFHDIGKGFANLDHSDYGEVLIRPLAARIGFSAEDCDTLCLLVKHHLLLSAVATRRDLDDPATIAFVVEQVGDAQTLELLHALSIADGEATGRTAWSDWKARLVADLVARCLASMSGFDPAPQLELTETQLAISKEGKLWTDLQEVDGNFEIEIIAPDSVGLLSIVAGVLSISRMDVRSARTRTVGDSAVMKWVVALDVHAPVPTKESISQMLQRGLSGDVDIASRIDDRIRSYRKFPGIPVAPPIVTAHNDVATNATILEVRMHDRPGVLYTVSKAVSRFGVDIRAAIVATLGAEAFDTLYLTDLQGKVLTPERAVLLANQVEQLLLTQ